MYRRICNMKRQLVIDYNERKGGTAASYGPEQCCPLGNATVSLILSALGVHSRRAFDKLSRYTRHHVVASLFHHTCAMRFDHFPSK